MNSKQFLSQLLRKENTVHVEDGQECMVCLGTVPVERQIQLPCNPKHQVGHFCIVRWLEAHNTCPLCRYEFFPAEQSIDLADDEEVLEVVFDEVADILYEDEDMSDEVTDSSDDSDFVDDGAEVNDDDENMSSEDDFSSDEDREDDEQDQDD